MDTLQMARAAERLLAEEVVQEAVSRLRTKFFHEWMSEELDEEARDALWHKTQGLNALLNELRIMADEKTFLEKNVT